jgi:uncharacterized protein YhdP
MCDFTTKYLIGLLLIFSVTIPVDAVAGSIDFKDFNMQGNPKNFQVTTRVEFDLTDYLSDALQSGVTINARVQFRLGQHRSWWFNKDTPLLTVQYQLKYHALSRHYLLTRIDTNENWNFSNRAAALRKLGELKKYSLPDITASINDDAEYYIFAIADMVPTTLNLPLRIQSIFSDQYRLTSEGVLWPLP